MQKKVDLGSCELVIKHFSSKKKHGTLEKYQIPLGFQIYYVSLQNKKL